MRYRRRWHAAAFSAIVVVTVPLAGTGCVPSAAEAAGGRITVTRLLTPDGDPLNGVNGINDAGEIAASEMDPVAVFNSDLYLWQDGRATRIDPEGIGSPRLSDLSESGQVVGDFASSSVIRGFSWRAGGLTPLEHEGRHTLAAAVNDRGQILGTVVPTDDEVRFVPAVWDRRGRVTAVLQADGEFQGVEINNRGQALVRMDRVSAIWRIGGGVTPLGTLGGASTNARDINDAGEVTGVSGSATGRGHAFVWRDGRMIDLGTLGGDWSAAYDINEAGQVVGAAEAADGSQHAVLWDRDGRLVDLGTLGGDSAEATAINERGQVVGWSATSSGESHAFLWEAGRMTDLNVLASDDTASGRAVDINERGQIVGTIGDRNLPSENFVAVLWTAPPRR